MTGDSRKRGDIAEKHYPIPDRHLRREKPPFSAPARAAPAPRTPLKPIALAHRPPRRNKPAASAAASTSMAGSSVNRLAPSTAPRRYERSVAVSSPLPALSDSYSFSLS